MPLRRAFGNRSLRATSDQPVDNTAECREEERGQNRAQNEATHHTGNGKKGKNGATRHTGKTGPPVIREKRGHPSADRTGPPISGKNGATRHTDRTGQNGATHQQNGLERGQPSYGESENEPPIIPVRTELSAVAGWQTGPPIGRAERGHPSYRPERGVRPVRTERATCHACASPPSAPASNR